LAEEIPQFERNYPKLHSRKHFSEKKRSQWGVFFRKVPPGIQVGISSQSTMSNKFPPVQLIVTSNIPIDLARQAEQIRNSKILNISF
jgi:hypothetical protein